MQLTTHCPLQFLPSLNCAICTSPCPPQFAFTPYLYNQSFCMTPFSLVSFAARCRLPLNCGTFTPTVLCFASPLTNFCMPLPSVVPPPRYPAYLSTLWHLAVTLPPGLLHTHLHLICSPPVAFSLTTLCSVPLSYCLACDVPALPFNANCNSSLYCPLLSVMVVLQLQATSPLPGACSTDVFAFHPSPLASSTGYPNIVT